MKRRLLIIALFVLIVPATTWVIAQGLQAMRLTDGSVERGIEMAQVESVKGQPSERIGPVGEPPITKWVYEDGEVVVFEYDRVVDSFYRSQ